MEDLHRGVGGGGGAHNQNIFVFSQEVDGFIAGVGGGLKSRETYNRDFMVFL